MTLIQKDFHWIHTTFQWVELHSTFLKTMYIYNTILLDIYISVSNNINFINDPLILKYNYYDLVHWALAQQLRVITIRYIVC